MLLTVEAIEMIARRDGRVLRLEHDGHTVVLETVDGNLLFSRLQ